MSENKKSRPFVLSIAALDGSSGAGLTADIKTLEQLQVYGLSVCTGLTVQHESRFASVRWVDLDFIKAQIDILVAKYAVEVCKIGLIENKAILISVLRHLHHKCPNIQIVLDPIMSASAGFDFHENANFTSNGLQWLEYLTLLTPNADELRQMAANDKTDLIAFAQSLTDYCAVLYKGGHRSDALGTDLLITNKKMLEIEADNSKQYYAKHGSGCVLSAAIAAFLAQGYSLEDACKNAKLYMNNFLSSTDSLLGLHNNS